MTKIGAAAASNHTSGTCTSSARAHAASASADHSQPQLAAVRANPRQQLQPALVKTIDGLDRQSMAGRTRHTEPGRGTDIDRYPVIGYRRAPRAHNLARAAVQSDHLAAKKARTGRLRQSAQIDVHLLKAVVTRDMTGQHA
jgi:hypothetical protein